MQFFYYFLIHFLKDINSKLYHQIAIYEKYSMVFLFQGFINMILATYLMPFCNLVLQIAYTYVYMKHESHEV